MFSRKTCCLLFLSLSLPILISNSTTANFFLVPRGRESRIGKKRFIAISVLVRSNQNHPKENTEKSNIDVEMPFFPPKTFLAQIYDPFRVFHQNSDFCRFLLILQEWSSVFVNSHWGACKLVSSSHSSSLEIHFQIFELMSIMPYLKKGGINGQFERASNISQILKAKPVEMIIFIFKVFILPKFWIGLCALVMHVLALKIQIAILRRIWGGGQ